MASEKIKLNDVVLEKGNRKDGSFWYSMRIVFATPIGKNYEKRIFLDDKDNMILGLEDTDFMNFVKRQR